MKRTLLILTLAMIVIAVGCKKNKECYEPTNPNCENYDMYYAEKQELENFKKQKNTAIVNTRIYRPLAFTINENQNWYNNQFGNHLNWVQEQNYLPYDNSATIDTIRADIMIADFAISIGGFPNLEYLLEHKSNCIEVLSIDTLIVKLQERIKN